MKQKKTAQALPAMMTLPDRIEKKKRKFWRTRLAGQRLIPTYASIMIAS